MMKQWRCDVCGCVVHRSDLVDKVVVHRNDSCGDYQYNPFNNEFDVCETCQKQLGLTLNGTPDSPTPDKVNPEAYVRCLLYRLRDLVAAKQPIENRGDPLWDLPPRRSYGGQASAVEDESVAG
jgi:hypothetical protein